MTAENNYPSRVWDEDLREWTREPMRDMVFYREFGRLHGADYGGTWDGYLQFQRKIVTPARPVPKCPGSFYTRQVHYSVTACTDEDIDDGTAAWMIQHGFTRTAEHPDG